MSAKSLNGLRREEIAVHPKEFVVGTKAPSNALENSSSAKAKAMNRHTKALDVKDFVVKIRTELQMKVTNFLLWAYGFVIAATVLIFMLQGFKLGGFSLDPNLLKWLGAATVGEIGGLLTLTLQVIFKK